MIIALVPIIPKPVVPMMPVTPTESETPVVRKTALPWACGTGVLEDSPVGMLRPTDAATRGEIARAVHGFCEEVVR